jgi:DNA-binding NtrC family response regulator
VGNVLILARDEVVAALLGLLVELKGFSPRFPEIQQSPEDALAGDRFAVVVIDCDHPQWSENLMRLIKASTAQPVFFSPLRMRHEVAELAARHGARSFTLPTDPESFGKVLEI